MISLRPATLADAKSLASRLRTADIQELASLGKTPGEALTESVQATARAYVAVDKDDAPICIFGVLDVGEGRGVVWLLGTDAIKQHYRQFLRLSWQGLALVMDGFTYLYNVADPRNDLHIRWIKWLGFKLGQMHPLGIHGEPFQFFDMRINHV